MSELFNIFAEAINEPNAAQRIYTHTHTYAHGEKKVAIKMADYLYLVYI